MPENFHDLVDIAIQQPGRTAMRPVVEKEILHYDIFHALDRAGLLRNLVFQGGTSLRLCRGSNRFSEDLDFAGGRDFTSQKMQAIKACIEKHLGARYGLAVEVKEPKEMAALPDYENVRVDKWQVSVETSPERRDMPRQRVKLEIANIPAYVDLVERKIEDYHIDDYAVLLADAMARLPGIIDGKPFVDQMSRFIDADTMTRTLREPRFADYLKNTVGQVFGKMSAHIGGMPRSANPDFRM